jgi:hypothetical protein
MAVVGWWKGFPIVQLLAYVMMVLWLLQLYPLWRRRHGWQVEIPKLPPIFAGELRSEPLLLKNLNAVATSAVVDIRLGEQTRRWYLQTILPKQQCQLSWSELVRKHGLWPLSVEIHESDAFGWFLRRQTVQVDEVVVLPAVGDIALQACREWLAEQAQGGELLARSAMRLAGGERAEVRGIRPYQPGDPFKSIHWRSTARRRRCMVREYEVAGGHPVWLTLLPPDPPQLETRCEQRWEAALSFATTLAYFWRWIAQAPLVLILAHKPPVVIQVPPSGQGLRFLLRPLVDPRLATAPTHRLAHSITPCLHLIVDTDHPQRSSGPPAIPYTFARQQLVYLSLDRLPSWYISPAHVAENPNNGVSTQRLSPHD